MADRSFRPYSSTEEYLVAVREDLAEWIATLYPDCGIASETFFEYLENGVLLCKLINDLIARLRETSASTRYPDLLAPSPSTRLAIVCRHNVQPRTFQARDNICNCLKWCRSMKMRECLLFETDDLVLRKNEKNVLLCLMELGRMAAKLGLVVPTLIQFEREIDEDELRLASSSSADRLGWRASASPDSGRSGSCDSAVDVDGEGDEVASCSMSTDSASSGAHCAGSPQHAMASLKNVDQVVKEHVKVCQCQSPFPLIKIAPGKYRVGTSHLQIYVRILRNHVMVRVGGGWDTLDHFLEKHDPCRRRGCCNEAPRIPPALSTSSTTTQQGLTTAVTRKAKIDLTPLQVVFNRAECPTGANTATTPSEITHKPPTSSTTKASSAQTKPAPSRTSIQPTQSVEPSVKLRRVSQPQSTVELRRVNQSTTTVRAQKELRKVRARSMDVGQLLRTSSVDQSSQTKLTDKPPLSRSTMMPQPIKPSETKPASVSVLPRSKQKSSVLEEPSRIPKSSSNVKLASKNMPRYQKKRFSMMELEDLPKVVHEATVPSPDENKNDPWSEAYQRHRKNFLRLKGLFDGKEGVKEDRGDSPLSSDGSDSSVAEFPEKREAHPEVRAHSVEEGFYSDVSA